MQLCPLRRALLARGLIALAALLPPALFAKRAAPAAVRAVLLDGIEYSAPASAMGYVVASDPATRKELWRQRIYTVVRNPALQIDVQGVFITSLRPDGRKLLIRDERGRLYLLDPQTRRVHRLE